MWGGDSHIKWVYWPMCRPRLKGRGLTELIKLKKWVLSELVLEPTYTFRADREANRAEKVGAFRANKLKKGGGGLYRGTYP